MLNRKVHPRVWRLFFDRLSKELHSLTQPKYAKLRRVIPTMAGTVDVAHWLPLNGITYDPNDRALYVMLEGLTHHVYQPEVIWTSLTSDGSFDTFLVLCRDGSGLSIELSNHQFPHDPSTFRREPSSRFTGKGRDRAMDLWKTLMSLLTALRQNDEDSYDKERRSPGTATDPGIPDRRPSGRPPHGRAHNRNSDGFVSKTVSRVRRARAS